MAHSSHNFDKVPPLYFENEHVGSRCFRSGYTPSLLIDKDDFDLLKSCKNFEQAIDIFASRESCAGRIISPGSLIIQQDCLEEECAVAIEQKELAESILTSRLSEVSPDILKKLATLSDKARLASIAVQRFLYHLIKIDQKTSPELHEFLPHRPLIECIIPLRFSFRNAAGDLVMNTVAEVDLLLPADECPSNRPKDDAGSWDSVRYSISNPVKAMADRLLSRSKIQWRIELVKALREELMEGNPACEEPANFHWVGLFHWDRNSQSGGRIDGYFSVQRRCLVIAGPVDDAPPAWSPRVIIDKSYGKKCNSKVQVCAAVEKILMALAPFGVVRMVHVYDKSVAEVFKFVLDSVWDASASNDAIAVFAIRHEGSNGQSERIEQRLRNLYPEYNHSPMKFFMNMPPRWSGRFMLLDGGPELSRLISPSEKLVEVLQVLQTETYRSYHGVDDLIADTQSSDPASTSLLQSTGNARSSSISANRDPPRNPSVPMSSAESGDVQKRKPVKKRIREDLVTQVSEQGYDPFVHQLQKSPDNTAKPLELNVVMVVGSDRRDKAGPEAKRRRVDSVHSIDASDSDDSSSDVSSSDVSSSDVSSSDVSSSDVSDDETASDDE